MGPVFDLGLGSQVLGLDLGLYKSLELALKAVALTPLGFELKCKGHAFRAQAKPRTSRPMPKILA